MWCEKDPQYLEVESEAAPAIEQLITSYPKYITVEELQMDSIEEKVLFFLNIYNIFKKI